jgi:hypothetical protein
MMDITKKDAERIARAAWGARATALEKDTPISPERRRAAEREWVALMDTPGSDTRCRDLSRIATAYRYSVGIMCGPSMELRGRGDTWREACERAGLSPQATP